ncbi:MAG: restriction endonuclease subunit S [Deltaproteobacteria bacterium]|nr:restriction endonuclease subunit S [Deltaproteobacteria bacterium]
MADGRTPLIIPRDARTPEHWPWKRLDQLAEAFDCPHTTPVLTADGPLVVRSQDMRSGVFRVQRAAHVSEATYRERVTRAEPRDGDILFSREGTYFGIAALVPPRVRVCLGQRMVLLRCDPGQVDPQFLRCWLNSPLLQRHVQGLRDGTVAERLNMPTIRALPVAVPPIVEQRSIARILGALDDKIELNRSVSETLEAMARALFKSWFVDFDPVRAKAEGRAPAGMDAATAALFPRRLVKTAAGDLPEGWRRGSIYEVADVHYGAPFSSSLFNSERRGRPLVRIRDLGGQRPDVFTVEEHPKGRLVRPGDVVVGMDGEFRAYLWSGSEAWLNQRCCLFAPRAGHSSAFVRHAIEGPLLAVEETETATTVIHLGKADIDRFQVVLPDARVASAFEHAAEPFYQRIVSAAQETRSLALLRDALLPRLLSGELRVADAERAIEAAE